MPHRTPALYFVDVSGQLSDDIGDFEALDRCQHGKHDRCPDHEQKTEIDEKAGVRKLQMRLAGEIRHQDRIGAADAAGGRQNERVRLADAFENFGAKRVVSSLLNCAASSGIKDAFCCGNCAPAEPPEPGARERRCIAKIGRRSGILAPAWRYSLT